MKSEKLVAKPGSLWQAPAQPIAADLVMYFGLREALEDGRLFAALRALYPDAAIVGCSTGGQILDDDVTDDVATAVAMQFEATQVKLSVEAITDSTASAAYGRAIGRTLAAPELAGVLVLSDGLAVNGSELTAGLVAELGPDIPLSGGLAGDGAAFTRTLVSGNAPPVDNLVVAVGLYGPKLKMRTGSGGGWDEFGPRRTVTSAVGNVLYALDGQPALDLYERYLGEEAAQLPGSALLFPLKISDPARPEHDIVRTVLSIDRDAKSMTFAGDVPQGWTAQLMRGRFDQLAEGSADAARQARGDAAEENGVALLISCIGRRLLMGQMVSEEIEAASAELAGNLMVGFYSYGEIAPHAVSRIAELHNQTMTITTIAEAA
jgi:hypothetical protein